MRAAGGRWPLAPSIGWWSAISAATAGEEVVVRRCGDDAVELHCHGGLAAVAMIEECWSPPAARALAWRDWAAPRG